MTFGTPGPKSLVIYKTDGNVEYVTKRTADVATFGAFAAQDSQTEGMPRKAELNPRHVGLKSADGLHRAHLPVATVTKFDSILLYSTVTYGGVDWVVTSKIGEKETDR